VDHEEDQADHQPEDREGVEDALEEGSQSSVLKITTDFQVLLLRRVRSNWFSIKKPLKDVFVWLLVIGNAKFCSDCPTSGDIKVRHGRRVYFR
jgi:hypothetical protein